MGFQKEAVLGEGNLQEFCQLLVPPGGNAGGQYEPIGAERHPLMGD